MALKQEQMRSPLLQNMEKRLILHLSFHQINELMVLASHERKRSNVKADHPQFCGAKLSRTYVRDCPDVNPPKLEERRRLSTISKLPSQIPINFALLDTFAFVEFLLTAHESNSYFDEVTFIINRNRHYCQTLIFSQRKLDYF